VLTVGTNWRTCRLAEADQETKLCRFQIHEDRTDDGQALTKLNCTHREVTCPHLRASCEPEIVHSDRGGFVFASCGESH
jgi:hypothetical protein